MRKWIRQPAAYPVFAIIGAGTLAVAFIARFHFTYNHSIVVNKLEPLQVFTSPEFCLTQTHSHARKFLKKDSEHIFSIDYINNNSVRNKYFNKETGMPIHDPNMKSEM